MMCMCVVLSFLIERHSAHRTAEGLCVRLGGAGRRVKNRRGVRLNALVTINLVFHLPSTRRVNMLRLAHLKQLPSDRLMGQVLM